MLLCEKAIENSYLVDSPHSTVTAGKGGKVWVPIPPLPLLKYQSQQLRLCLSEPRTTQAPSPSPASSTTLAAPSSATTPLPTPVLAASTVKESRTAESSQWIYDKTGTTKQKPATALTPSL
ncbi:hypothetical protein EJ03DRAFT_350737 [Teratosphaeria nubilosa]|uniref:Uncharacterized protein n=1 Tax=Teratosphaeria nubilosa TaxID=161662 RepID=A0A6G1LC71_9PEZI|nr:hypothetical protein EJ03DRAFT_350737 [Teratosphaeria nubilosa]